MNNREDGVMALTNEELERFCVDELNKALDFMSAGNPYQAMREIDVFQYRFRNYTVCDFLPSNYWEIVNKIVSEYEKRTPGYGEVASNNKFGLDLEYIKGFDFAAYRNINSCLLSDDVKKVHLSENGTEMRLFFRTKHHTFLYIINKKIGGSVMQQYFDAENRELKQFLTNQRKPRSKEKEEPKEQVKELPKNVILFKKRM